jgi:hypothetical protein
LALFSRLMHRVETLESEAEGVKNFLQHLACSKSNGNVGDGGGGGGGAAGSPGGGRVPRAEVSVVIAAYTRRDVGRRCELRDARCVRPTGVRGTAVAVVAAMPRLFSLLFVLSACAFDGGGIGVPALPDAAEVADAAELPDASVIPDAAEVPDAAAATPDARVGLDTGAACNNDDDCASGACESFDIVGKRCAALCEGPNERCPLGTECDEGVCVED